MIGTAISTQPMPAATLTFRASVGDRVDRVDVKYDCSGIDPNNNMANSSKYAIALAAISSLSRATILTMVVVVSGLFSHRKVDMIA